MPFKTFQQQSVHECYACGHCDLVFDTSVKRNRHTYQTHSTPGPIMVGGVEVPITRMPDGHLHCVLSKSICNYMAVGRTNYCLHLKTKHGLEPISSKSVPAKRESEAEDSVSKRPKPATDSCKWQILLFSHSSNLNSSLQQFSGQPLWWIIPSHPPTLRRPLWRMIPCHPPTLGHHQKRTAVSKVHCFIPGLYYLCAR